MNEVRFGIDPLHFYKVNELAKALNIDPKVLGWEVERGVLRAFHLSTRAVRFYGADVIDYLEASEASERCRS